MRLMKDLKFQRFGRLIALEPLSKRRFHQIVWKCRCDCGNIIEVPASSLSSGNTQSCGCFQRELLSKRQTTHGLSLSSEFKIWAGIFQRVYNPKNPAFDRYGGRGVKVCKRWFKFENFFKDMGKRPPGKSIDRYPNNDGNYEPGNCRWATPKEQTANRRDGKNQHWFLAFNTNSGEWDEDNNQHDFARRHGLNLGEVNNCLHGRAKRHKGWEFDYLPFQS